ncbi:MAG: tRNA (adenosine(37)-N6)-threonylcarbamoyltransferase complex dimerization subunit type 1 TsaB [Limibacillus sp.]
MTENSQVSAPCLLAFDAAGRSCSAAVFRDGEVLAEAFEPMSRGQAERLVPMIEEVLATAGLRHGALDALAVTVGPGAFTGVRIGLAAARGYGLALGIPQIGVTCLEAVAGATEQAERRGRRLLVLLDAKRADLYAQFFDEALTPLGEPFTATPGELAARLAGDGGPPLLLAGDGVEQAFQALEDLDPRRSKAVGLHASAVARAAAAKPWPDKRARLPGPLYLRPPDDTHPHAAPAG